MAQNAPAPGLERHERNPTAVVDGRAHFYFIANPSVGEPCGPNTVGGTLGSLFANCGEGFSVQFGETPLSNENGSTLDEPRP